MVATDNSTTSLGGVSVTFGSLPAPLLIRFTESDQPGRSTGRRRCRRHGDPSHGERRIVASAAVPGDLRKSQLVCRAGKLQFAISGVRSAGSQRGRVGEFGQQPGAAWICDLSFCQRPLSEPAARRRLAATLHRRWMVDHERQPIRPVRSRSKPSGCFNDCQFLVPDTESIGVHGRL